MAYYQFIQTQKLPSSIDEVWDFISRPENLKDITPAYMGFAILSNLQGQKMYAGMLVSYIVKPIMGIPLKWLTEITHVVDKSYFVDEQRMGPYKMWHHQHKIEIIDGVVLMTDIISYIPPLGIIGTIANSLFIKKQLKEIFEFRRLALEAKFGTCS